MRKLEKNLNQLEKNIKLGKFNENLEKIEEWGGADVIIAKEETLELKKWVGEESLVIALDGPMVDGNKLVITKNAKELSWLFYQLKDIFKDHIDFSNKYYFYGILAKSAILFIVENKNYKPEELLCYVLNNGAYKILKMIKN